MTSNRVETDFECFLDFQKDLENELLDFGLKIGQHEENIKLLESQQKAIESNLLELKVARDQSLCMGTYGSPGKLEITARVERKSDSAAAIVMKLFREVSDQDCYGLMGNIIGVVALLGTTPSLELSRIFSEYLGDQMLAVVCKSYEDVRLLEAYKKNGKLNRAHALHMFAAELGQSINGRYPVLCVEDIRACKAGKDLQGKLLLPDPTLPNGATPVGFLGYAVNMINIDIDHLNTRTDSGCDLRETLFYRLFGEAQVYKTRQDMKREISCIKDGAVSLDGGIYKGNGAVSLGCWEPDIIFPIAPAINQVFSPCTEHVLKHYCELKLKMKETMSQLINEKKSHESALKKFKKRRDIYAKYFTRKDQSTDAS